MGFKPKKGSGVYNMFDLLRMQDWGDYEKRKVDRCETGNLIVDTCEVLDQPDPYNFETAVRHKGYNNGEWIIVELYEVEAEALLGHKKWVKVMTSRDLPKQLVDVSKVLICQLKDKLDEGEENWRVFKRSRVG